MEILLLTSILVLTTTYFAEQNSSQKNCFISSQFQLKLCAGLVLQISLSYNPVNDLQIAGKTWFSTFKTKTKMAEKPQCSKSTNYLIMLLKLQILCWRQTVICLTFQRKILVSRNWKWNRRRGLAIAWRHNETSAKDVPTDFNNEHSNNVQHGVITVNSEHCSKVPTVTKEKKFTVRKPGPNITSVDPLETFNLFFTDEII